MKISTHFFQKYFDNFLYDLEELQSTDSNYMLIKKSFSNKSLNLVKTALNKSFTMRVYRVYRVIKPKSNDFSKKRNNNLLLLHGTNLHNSVGILKSGFKPSLQGNFGHGVYMTSSSTYATDASIGKIPKSSENKQIVVLVNEVLQSENLKEINSQTGLVYFIFFAILTVLLSYYIVPIMYLMVFFLPCYLPRNNSFEWHIVSMTAEEISDDDYERDSVGRRIKVRNENVDDYNNHFVCDENLVVPAYLVHFDAEN